MSFLLGEQPGNENRSGVPLKCFEHQERDLPSKSVGEEYKPGVLGQTPFARDRNSEKNSEEVCIISDHGLNSQTTGLNSKKLDICKEEQASFEWTEYEFPSSEDLSAFLADLELDALNKTKEQSQPFINSKKSSRPKPCVTSEGKTPGEIVTSQTVSFSDLGYGFVQEDYTEFTDFPSFEDLDAFLADMELACETILQKTSLAPADVMRSADAFDLHQKVEVSIT